MDEIRSIAAPQTRSFFERRGNPGECVLSSAPTGRTLSKMRYVGARIVRAIHQSNICPNKHARYMKNFKSWGQPTTSSSASTEEPQAFCQPLSELLHFYF